ncbi:hypothetical protein ASZ90_010876 [hydrocarbon metagenome]|uniref:Uncharacterized protein n=1 Tax=hydrocarbon metagenome TaxID=938273 RepID=A0A0W8FET6_9ZZZZ
MLRFVHRRDVLVVPVDCQRILDEIVRPERCKLDAGTDEVLDQDGAARYLDHDPERCVLHVDAPPPHQLLCPDELRGMVHHGEHDAEVAVSPLPEPLERLHLHPELVRGLQVAPYPAPAEHGVVLYRFVLAALHIPELVGRRIERPDPDRFAVECIEHGPDAVVEFRDEFLLPPVADEPARRPVQPKDQVLDSEEADAVCSGRSGPFCGLRQGYVHLDERRGDERGCRHRDLSGRFLLFNLNGTLIDEPTLAVDRHDLARFQHLRRLPRADDCRCAELPADDGGMAGHPSLVGDDRCHPPHCRHHVGIGHPCDKDISLKDRP